MTIFPLEPQPERDRWGRPLVVPPGGGQPTAYTRCTTYVGCLDDTFKLGQWMQRMVALGLAERDDLRLAVLAHRDDKKHLDTICDNAREHAGGDRAATTGTALHALTERLDRGDEVGHVPAEVEADLRAYEKATAGFTALHIERFVVQDDLKVGGTPDRVVEYEGEHYIADLKTGSVEWGGLKIAMQLAMYANSRLYDVRSHQRADLPNVNKQRGIVIHLPAGSGKAELLWANLAQGWEAIDVARQVRDWRRLGRGMLRPLDVQASLLPDPEPEPRSTLEDTIAGADSVEALGALWREYRHVWTPALTEAAAARKQALLGSG